MKTIYIACPYSSNDKKQREERFKAVSRYAGTLINDGFNAYSPISHSHPIAEQGALPLEWDYWEQIDRHWIGCCEELWIYMLDGWNKSKGIAAEIEIANQLKKPVKYVKP